MLRHFALGLVLLRVSARRLQPAPWYGDTYTQTTIDGCTCITDCAAAERDNFKCDTCSTMGNCGQKPNSKFEFSWDICDFSPRRNFDHQTWQSKTSYWWNHIIADKTTNPSLPSPVLLFSQSQVTTFDNFLPEMPEGRLKLIHPHGTVCKVKVQITSNSPYTGLLAPGLIEGFVRLGDGAAIPADGLSPGLGFKFPRTDVPSGDFVAMKTLNRGSWNFFAPNLSNHFDPIGEDAFQNALHDKFKTGSQCSSQVGLSDLSKYTQDGVEIADPKFPFKLNFMSNEEIHMNTNEKTMDDLMDHFGKFPIGTKLYSMYACAKPTAHELQPTANCGGELYLGDLITTSECTRSLYGDTKFHIRHQRVEDDWKLNPAYFNSEGYSAQRECRPSPVNQVTTIEGRPKPCGMLNSDP